MADEITITCSLEFTNDGVTASMDEPGVKTDQAQSTALFTQGKMSAAITSGTAIPLGAVNSANIGLMQVKNLDTTASIRIDEGSGTDGVLIKAGETQLFRHNGTNPTATSLGAAAANMEYLLLED